MRTAGPTSSGGVLDEPGVADVRLGVSLAAIAVIMQGSHKLADQLCPDPARQVLFTLACAATIVCAAWWATPLCLAVAGCAYVAHVRVTSRQLAQAEAQSVVGESPEAPVARSAGGAATATTTGHAGPDVAVKPSAALLPPVAARLAPPFGRGLGLALFAGSWVVLLPFLACQLLADAGSAAWGTCPAEANIVGIFYRVGCLVFGSGPVVVPLLLTQLAGLIPPAELLLGFAAVNMLPGPMFNVAAFCGALLGGWPMALACWAAVMLPGVFMAIGALPFWAWCRRVRLIQDVLAGVNAATAGLMAAACVSLMLHLVAQSAWRASSLVLLVAAQRIGGLGAPFVIAQIGRAHV